MVGSEEVAVLDYVRNALISIWSNKVRSVLTVLGVVIGVTSVTTLVSLGEGLKKDVSASIRGFGTNVITVISGKINTSSPNQANTNPANFIAGDILTLGDVKSIEAISDVQTVTPVSLVSGSIKYEDKLAVPTLFGAYPNLLEAIEILPLDSGRMFRTQNEGNVIILGPNAKTDLFGDTDPIGQTVTIGKDDFEVIGTLGKSKTVGLFGSEFDAISIIPFDSATRLNKDQVKIMRIVIKAAESADVEAVRDQVASRLRLNHDNEEDFTVLTQEDLLSLFSQFLNLATTMVSAIAAISLIVGGIGIMNIMLVTVTERTKEIGLRKAVGATKFAILIQFLTEAIIITFVGALIGLAITFIASAIIRAKTELQPVTSWEVIGIAVGISVIVGIIFGLWPAVRAANKDPIEALAYE